MSCRAFVPMLVAVAVSIGCVGGAREALVSEGDVGAQETTHVRVASTGVRGASRGPRSIITLLVGDTIAMGAKSNDARRYLLRSSDPVLAQDPAGHFVAKTLGTTSLLAPSTSPGGAPDTIMVRVMTSRQLTNSTITEVCPNRDSAAIASEQPYQSQVSWIHEYHDCQRLIAGGEYGPPVGIFAHKNVATYASPDSFKDGRLAALIVNFPTKNVRTKQDTASYLPLGLKPGTSCLILRWTGTWEAAIVNQSSTFSPKGANYGDCGDGMSWADVMRANPRNVTPLIVKTQHGVDPSGKAIVPPVARWDWDPRAHVNYIGVKCGDAEWCEIGRAKLTTSKARHVGGYELIKGYYDEQFLADSTGAHPSNVFGTILPLVTAAPPTSWVHKATVSLRVKRFASTGALDYYARRFRLARGGNELGIPGGTGVPVPVRIDTTLDEIMPRSSRPGDGFLLRMNGVEDESKASIVYRTHPGSVMTQYPIARWRWLEKDETTWFSCPPDGCCETTVADM